MSFPTLVEWASVFFRWNLKLRDLIQHQSQPQEISDVAYVVQSMKIQNTGTDHRCKQTFCRCKQSHAFEPFKHGRKGYTTHTGHRKTFRSQLKNGNRCNFQQEQLQKYKWLMNSMVGRYSALLCLVHIFHQIWQKEMSLFEWVSRTRNLKNKKGYASPLTFTSWKWDSFI